MMKVEDLKVQLSGADGFSAGSIVIDFTVDGEKVQMRGEFDVNNPRDFWFDKRVTEGPDKFDDLWDYLEDPPGSGFVMCADVSDYVRDKREKASEKELAKILQNSLDEAMWNIEGDDE